MKAWLGVILCFAFIPASAAFAQQPNDAATKEDVQEMVSLVNSRKQFDALMDVMKQQIPALSRSALKKQFPNATPEDAAKMDAFTGGILEKMFQNMPYDEMMQAMIPAYQHHFTHEELQQLVQFYSSSVGRKMVAEMPAIMAEYMTASQPIMLKWMDAQMADLRVSAENYAKTLKAKKVNVTDPKTKPTS